MVDLTDLRLDKMEVVEQPFRAWRDGVTLVDIIGKRPIQVAQKPGIVIEPSKQYSGTTTRVPCQRQDAGKSPSTVFQALETEQLAAQQTRTLFVSSIIHNPVVRSVL
jgi:hypothetical protein